MKPQKANLPSLYDIYTYVHLVTDHVALFLEVQESFVQVETNVSRFRQQWRRDRKRKRKRKETDGGLFFMYIFCFFFKTWRGK